MPVQNMKLAMAGVLPGGAPTQATPRPPTGFISLPDNVPELSWTLCLSIRYQKEEVSMADRLHDDEMDRQAPASGSIMRSGRQERIVREPTLTGKELVAYAVILIMVCGPLALGAFGL
jgi:hypothetical protein